MIGKGKISHIVGDKAVVIPGHTSNAVTFPLVVPENIKGSLKANDPVLYAMFDDNTGIVICRMDGTSISQVVIDSALDDVSKNPVENRVIDAKFKALEESIADNFRDLDNKIERIYATKTDVTEAVKNLKLGGRNLILQSESFEHTRTDATKNWLVPYPQYKNSEYGVELIKQGGEFTLSFDYEITGITTACNLIPCLEYANQSHSNIGITIPLAVGDNSGRVEHTFTPTATQMQWGRQWLFSGFGAGQNENAVITIEHIKLEKGNKVTDWTPAPEDKADIIHDHNMRDITGLENALSNKVDKVTGKGLSTNDYTTAEKNKLKNIEAGAQVNTITGVKGNAETAFRTGEVNLTPANIGAAASAHNHSATNITSGTLPIARGGTGVTTYVDLLKKLHPASDTTPTYVCTFDSSWENGGYASLKQLRSVMGLGNTTGVLPIANGGTGVNSVFNEANALQVFGLASGGTVIPADANLNTYVTPGNYYCSSNSFKDTMLNYPSEVANLGFMLKVSRQYGNTSAYIQQDIIVGSNFNHYTRRSSNNGSSWGTWTSVHTKNATVTGNRNFTGTVNIGAVNYNITEAEYNELLTILGGGSS